MMRHRHYDWRELCATSTTDHRQYRGLCDRPGDRIDRYSLTTMCVSPIFPFQLDRWSPELLRRSPFSSSSTCPSALQLHGERAATLTRDLLHRLLLVTAVTLSVLWTLDRGRSRKVHERSVRRSCACSASRQSRFWDGRRIGTSEVSSQICLLHLCLRRSSFRSFARACPASSCGSCALPWWHWSVRGSP